MSIAVILLNWNGGAETIGCLESVLHLRGISPKIVVCDNGSTDNSVAYLRGWAAGELVPDLSQCPSGCQRPVAKPLRLAEFTRQEAENAPANTSAAEVYLIHTGANLGFAGGNNVGVRFALADPACTHVWLLNNDTVVDADALAELLKRASQRDQPGIVGSTLCFYGAPNTVQALAGGSFSLWRAMSRHIGEGSPRRALCAAETAAVERDMSYVVGASMLVSRAFLEQVGLMEDDYFLYFEEMDWAERGRRCTPSWRLGFAANSIVYHKVGAAAGTAKRSMTSLRYLNANRLRFVKRFHARWLVVARLQVAWDGLKALLKGQFAEAQLLVHTAFAPVRV